MNFAFLFIVVSSALVLANAQFPQYPSQFSDNQVPQQYNPFTPYRGGFQVRPPPPLPPRFNPFDNVYNTKGEKLTCKMVCGVEEVEEVEGMKTMPPPEKKDSDENKTE